MKRNTRQNKEKKPRRPRREALSAPLTTQAGDQIHKKFTLPDKLLTSAPAGNINPISFSNGLVTTATEWPSFAARYQQYRIKDFMIHWYPLLNVNLLGQPLSMVATSDFIGTSTPVSFQQIISDERSRLFSSAHEMHVSVGAARNPNAKLWNPTTAVPPVANTMNLAFASSILVPFPGLTNIYYGVFEWVVEFRGSQ